MRYMCTCIVDHRLPSANRLLAHGPERKEGWSMSNEEANLERLHADWWELKQAVHAVLDEYVSVERVEPGRPIPGPARTFDSDGARRIEEAERKAETVRGQYNRALMLHMGAD